MRDAAAAGAFRAVARLTVAQRPSGELPTFWSPSPDLSRPTRAESPFITGLALLLAAELPAAGSLRRRGAAYLRGWRRADGLFAFLRDGIDPDLDDTCLLGYVLQREDPSWTGFPALARRVAGLPCRAGLFETWVRPVAGAPNDVDPCVSVNVLRFLHHNGIARGETEDALRRAFHDPASYAGTLYYHPPLSLPWLVLTLAPPLRARLVGNRFPRALVDRASAAAQGDANATDLALALLVATRAGAHPQVRARLAKRLLEREEGHGCWRGTAFFRAFNYWGSAELTTAVAAHALSAFATAP